MLNPDRDPVVQIRRAIQRQPVTRLYTRQDFDRITLADTGAHRYLPHVVVFPLPCKPQSMMTVTSSLLPRCKE